VITPPPHLKIFGHFPYVNNAKLSAEISQPMHTSKAPTLQSKKLLAMGVGALILAGGVKFLLGKKNKLSLFVKPDDFKADLHTLLKSNTPLAFTKTQSKPFFTTIKDAVFLSPKAMQPEPITCNKNQESKKILKYLGFESLGAVVLGGGTGLIRKLRAEEEAPVAPLSTLNPITQQQGSNFSGPIDHAFTVTNRANQVVEVDVKRPKHRTKSRGKSSLKASGARRRIPNGVGFLNNGRVFAPTHDVPTLPAFEQPTRIDPRTGESERYQDGGAKICDKGTVFGTDHDVYIDHYVGDHKKLTHENDYSSERGVFRLVKGKYLEQSIPYLSPGLLNRAEFEPGDIFNAAPSNQPADWVDALAHFASLGKL